MLPLNIVVVVLTLFNHGSNAVRGHRTDANNSGVEDYLTRMPYDEYRVGRCISHTPGGSFQA